MEQFVKLSLIVILFFPSLLFAAEGESSKGPLPPPAIPGPDNINTYLHVQVNNLVKAAPPRIWDRKLILTYKGEPETRYVAAAFVHENFREKHLFFKNQNNVFFLVYDLPEETPDELDYRLIVDGLWQSDPQNTHRFRNDQGIVLSQVSIKEDDKPRLFSPIQKFGGQVEFRYRGRSGQQIAVAGNFNSWDPFSLFLEEDPARPGEYTLVVDLPPGDIFYQYVIGTKTILDPLNPHTAHDQNGAEYSYFANRNVARPTVLESRVRKDQQVSRNEE